MPRVPLLAAAAVLVPAAALAAAAPAAPHRKAGWWEMTSTMAMPTTMTTKMNMCTDAATEARNNAFASNQGPGVANCTQGPMGRTPTGGWTFSSTCKMQGGITTTTSGVATGDFNSNYRVEATTRMSPAPMPQMAETKMTLTGRWLGACPAGRVPGDMVMANGMVFNVNKLNGGR
jgi:hypothetical protein